MSFTMVKGYSGRWQRVDLSPENVKRLTEALDNVSAAIPRERDRRGLRAVWHHRAWNLPDTNLHRFWRGRLFRMLPDTVRPDWHWIISVIADPGFREVWEGWTADHGYTNATST